MKEENINNTIEKYKDGKTSLKEEKFLFDNLDESEEGLKMLASFVKKSKKEIPENFNDNLWASFEKKTKKTNKFKIGVLSVAASVALIFSVFIYKNNENKLSEIENAALLEEAKNMFLKVDQEKEMYRKILEDELIIVYAKTE